MTATVEAVRTQIAKEIEGKTLCHLFHETVAANAERDAFAWLEADAWKKATWADYGRIATQASAALAALGVTKGDHVAIMATNRPEHVIADMASLLAGGIPVSVYNTLAEEQIAYVAGNCAAKVAVLEDATFLKRWQSVRDQLPALEHVIVLDGPAEGAITWEELLEQGADALAGGGQEGFDARWQAVAPDDPATLIYTSGTTGPPKGVVITHRNVLTIMSSVKQALDLPVNQTIVSYLPLAHVAERTFSHYQGMKYAACVYFCKDMNKVGEVLPVARPQAFLAVPRVWEKMRMALRAAIAAAEPRKKRLGEKAFAVAEQKAGIELSGKKPSILLTLQYGLFERLVYSKVRARVGLDRCQNAITGAAPMPDDLIVFFKGLGIEICNVYGMTETTAVTNANLPGKIKLGTVGPALPGVEVAIAPDGEIIARGANMTPGYHKRPDATAELFDSDRWLHTGDLGSIDADGYLTITGRKKELIITAGGKNISPVNIETLVKQQSPIIGQVMAIGDDRQFISALIVLDPDSAPAWAAKKGVSGKSLAELAEHVDVVAEVQRAVDGANTKLARVEQIKKFEVLPTDWTVESGELTPSLKLKRHVVVSKYSDVIDSMYGAA